MTTVKIPASKKWLWEISPNARLSAKDVADLLEYENPGQIYYLVSRNKFPKPLSCPFTSSQVMLRKKYWSVDDIKREVIKRFATDDFVDKNGTLNTKEAARLLGLSTGTLYNDRRSGHFGIPYVRIGYRTVIYQKKDLLEWIDKHKKIGGKSIKETGERL